MVTWGSPFCTHRPQTDVGTRNTLAHFRLESSCLQQGSRAGGATTAIFAREVWHPAIFQPSRGGSVCAVPRSNRLSRPEESPMSERFASPTRLRHHLGRPAANFQLATPLYGGESGTSRPRAPPSLSQADSLSQSEYTHSFAPGLEFRQSQSRASPIVFSGVGPMAPCRASGIRMKVDGMPCAVIERTPACI